MISPSRADVATALGDLVKRFGKGVGENPDALQAKLRDVCGTSPRECAALVEAARNGIPHKLLSSAGAPIAVTAAILARRWSSSSTIDERMAAWATNAWAQALGLEETLPLPDDDEKTKSFDGVRRPARNHVVVAGAFLLAFIIAAAGYFGWRSARKSEAASAVVAAQQAAKQSDSSTAHDRYRHAQDLDPGNRDAWFLDGVLWYQSRDYDAAISDFDRAIGLDSHKEDAFAYKGSALDQLQKYAQAVPVLQGAVSLDSGDETAWRDLAYAEYYTPRLMSAALRDVKRALALNSSDKYAQTVECKAAYTQNDSIAYQACKAAASGDFVKSDFLLQKARAMTILSGSHASEYQDAYNAMINAYALPEGKNDFLVWNNFARVAMFLGKYTESYDAYQGALKKWPTSPTLWNNIGVLEQREGFTTIAFCDYKKALAYDSSYTLARENLNALHAAQPFLRC